MSILRPSFLCRTFVLITLDFRSQANCDFRHLSMSVTWTYARALTRNARRGSEVKINATVQDRRARRTEWPFGQTAWRRSDGNGCVYRTRQTWHGGVRNEYEVAFEDSRQLRVRSFQLTNSETHLKRLWYVLHIRRGFVPVTVEKPRVHGTDRCAGRNFREMAPGTLHICLIHRWCEVDE